MGMAASQVRFLGLTGRDHDISRELLHLSNQKSDLARDMDVVTLEYQRALSSKTVKWSSNSGVTLTNLNYSLLMSPNSNNMKSPVLISDSSGKIVLNKNYQKYAQMLDEAGGSWSGDIKNKILSELTGIPQSTIETANTLSDNVVTAANDYETLRSEYDEWLYKENKLGGAGTEYLSIDKLAKKLDLKGDYSIRSANDIHVLADTIKNSLSKYFVDDEVYLGVKDRTAFVEACDSFASTYSVYLNSTGKNADEQRNSMGIKGSDGNWSIDVSLALSTIMDIYSGTKNGSVGKKNSSEEITYPIRNTESTAWSKWYEELKTKYNAREAAKTNYNSAVDVSNQAMNAEQETKLKYYDLLFQSVADNGWTYDSQIDDAEYLSQMFQNNAYYITTITENSCYNENVMPGPNNAKFIYDSTLATDFDKICLVNDSDAREEALVNYEHKKRLINTKETRIDERMQNLKTEQASIQKMLEGIKEVIKNNTERTFNLWG